MKGYPVDMVLSKAEGAYLNSVPAHVRVVDLGSSRPLRALPALVRYLSAEKPQALLSTIMNANLAAVLASQFADVNTRCVICEASNISTELHHWAHNRFLMPLLIRRFFPKAHAIVAVSHGAADDLARMAGFPDSRSGSSTIRWFPRIC